MIATHRTAALQFEAFFRTKNGEACYTCHVCGHRAARTFGQVEGLMMVVLWHLKRCDRADAALTGSFTIDGERSAALVADDGRRMIVTTPKRDPWGTIYDRVSPRPAAFF